MRRRINVPDICFGGKRNMKISNRAYDILNKVQRWLPAVGVFYLALCQTWGFRYGDEINTTIVAVATLLATTLEIANGEYLKEEVKNG